MEKETKPKSKTKKTKVNKKKTGVKAKATNRSQAQAVNQVVNIKIGDTKTSKKKSKSKSKQAPSQQVSQQAPQQQFARVIYPVQSSNEPQPMLNPLNPSITSKMSSERSLNRSGDLVSNELKKKEARKLQQLMINDAIKVKKIESLEDEMKRLTSTINEEIELDEKEISFFRDKLIEVKKNIKKEQEPIKEPVQATDPVQEQETMNPLQSAPTNPTLLPVQKGNAFYKKPSKAELKNIIEMGGDIPKSKLNKMNVSQMTEIIKKTSGDTDLLNRLNYVPEPQRAEEPAPQRAEEPVDDEGLGGGVDDSVVLGNEPTSNIVFS